MAIIIAIYPGYIVVDSNPALGLGTPADIGTLAIAEDSSGVYYKYGTLDIEWQSYGQQNMMSITSLRF